MKNGKSNKARYANIETALNGKDFKEQTEIVSKYL